MISTRNCYQKVLELQKNRFLEALQAFAVLNAVVTEAGKDVDLHDCLIRTCFKAGVKLKAEGLVLGKKCDTAVIENALLEFCFGACDEPYAERERFLDVQFSKSLQSDFLKRWIERAEATEYRHNLTLHVSFWPEGLPQETDDLDAYKQDGHTEWETCFGSVSGRHWTARCSGNGRGIGSSWIIFEIVQ